MPTIVYLPHELSPLLYVIDDRVTRVVGMSTRRQSYRHPAVRRADVQVALMHTAGDVVLRMAVGHTSAAMPRDSGGGESAHWHHVKGAAGVLEWNRTPDGAPKLWVEDWEIDQPISVPWTTTPRDAPPEAAASGHGGRDYYVFAQFADAVSARRAGGARRLRGGRHRGAGDPGGGLDRFRQRTAGRARLPPRTRTRRGRAARRCAAVTDQTAMSAPAAATPRYHAVGLDVVPSTMRRAPCGSSPGAPSRRPARVPRRCRGCRC